MYFLELFVLFGFIIVSCLVLLAVMFIHTRIKYGMWFPPRDMFGDVDRRLLSKALASKKR